MNQLTEQNYVDLKDMLRAASQIEQAIHVYLEEGAKLKASVTQLIQDLMAILATKRTTHADTH